MPKTAFDTAMDVFAALPDGGQAVLQELSAYLDSVAFHGICKYLSSVNMYSLRPGRLSAAKDSALADRGLVLSVFSGARLAACLAGRVPCRLSDLTEVEKELLPKLESVGLMERKDETIAPGQLQLISIYDRYLLIDAAVHFPLGRVHDVYIGPDSALVLYYMTRRQPSGMGLDLCSGSGVLALGLLEQCADVRAVELSPSVARLVRINAALNGCAGRVDIVNGRLEDELSLPDRYDRITCNPPFVPFPVGVDGPLYAHGPDTDGQGYVRQVLRALPRKLTSGGEALIVTDFAGSDTGPLFIEELRAIATEAGLSADVYIDGRVPVASHTRALAGFSRLLHPLATQEEVQTKMEELFVRTIGARYMYMTTLRIRLSDRPTVRTMNRMAPPEQ